MTQGIDDREFRIPEYSKVCSYCAHWDLTAKRKCKAFDEIPMPIWMGENDHREAYEGDGGIQFEPYQKSEEEVPAGPLDTEWLARHGIIEAMDTAERGEDNERG